MVLKDRSYYLIVMALQSIRMISPILFLTQVSTLY